MAARTVKEVRGLLAKLRSSRDQLMAEFAADGQFGDWLPRAQSCLQEMPRPLDRSTQGFRIALTLLETQLLMQRLEASLAELEDG